VLEKKTGKKSRKAPQFVKKGQKVIARLETPGPICVETFEDYPQLGRFTLRDEGLISFSFNHYIYLIDINNNQFI
jgi:peptide chain release factor subunit 3